MARILHIQASPRGGESSSTRAAETLLAELERIRPGDAIETLDLFAAALPEFAAPAARAKYAVMGGQAPADEAQRAWERVIRVIDHFRSADAYVISSPMWNFGIPYRLKHYVDILLQPGLTFSFSPDAGYEGLVTGKQAVLVLSRGGAYLPGTGMESHDFQEPYLRTILGFIGITDVHEIVIEPTIHGGPEVAEEAIRRAAEQARAAAGEIAASL